MFSCVDINECDRYSPCDQVCINNEGSFMCSCQSGYELDEDMQNCIGIVIGYYSIIMHALCHVLWYNNDYVHVHRPKK